MSRTFTLVKTRAAAGVNSPGVAEMDILWQGMRGWNNETFVHLACILTETGALLIVGAPDINTVSWCTWMDYVFLY